MALITVPAAAQEASSSGPIQPFWGDISPFYGDISPFWGDISPFWGDISPFWGDISPFWGDISPFWGDISPFWGDISPFWGDISPFWGDISPFMQGLQNLDDNQDPTTLLEGLITNSEAFWGASVEAQTGQSFRNGFVADLFAQYGLGPQGEGFEALSVVDRARFLFAWRDGLMSFSGRDQVDYWMGVVNWSPSLAQTAGGGAGVTIGLFDFTIASDALLGALTRSNHMGYNNVGAGHGDAVAGLLLAPHDGQGVMGMAPGARVFAHNPFDATGTASWDDLANGFRRLRQQGATVVNLSLGVPGYTFAPDWMNLYRQAQVRQTLGGTVFVHAAGNEGHAQSANIPWDFSLNPAFLVVGSVGPSGQISAFSNTPGNACLLQNGACRLPLMNRFLVAPGEWVLVSDGQGGVTRASGASFAAPQVTGAVALVQGRWPWLRNHARETADLILNSATDLGAPGVDPVYGRGLLNVEATQAPLNMANLYMRSTSGARIQLSAGGTGSLLTGANGYVVVYEDLGATYRDFVVPLDASIVSTSTVTNMLRAYVSTLRAVQTATGSSPTTGSTKKEKKRFEDGFSLALANPYGLDLRMRIAAPAQGQSLHEGALPYAVDLMIAGEGASLFTGYGAGALALTGQFEADALSFDPSLGGADPILGLASGGAYVAAETDLGYGLTLTAGVTTRDHHWLETNPLTGEEMPLIAGVDPYRSAAARMQVRADLNETLSVTAAYTHLSETNGLLGLQSANPDAFRAGAQTDAATLGLSWTPRPRISLMATATRGRSQAHSNAEQAYAVGAEGIDLGAYEATLTLNGVFSEDDTARLRIGQPMHVRGGSLNVTNIEVVDRETGAFGPVTQTVTLGARSAPVFVESLYATSVLNDRAQLGLFARLDASPEDAAPLEQLVGLSLRLGF
jgi:hypothetical protein